MEPLHYPALNPTVDGSRPDSFKSQTLGNGGMAGVGTVRLEEVGAWG